MVTPPSGDKASLDRTNTSYPPRNIPNEVELKIKINYKQIYVKLIEKKIMLSFYLKGGESENSCLPGPFQTTRMAEDREKILCF